MNAKKFLLFLMIIFILISCEGSGGGDSNNPTPVNPAQNIPNLENGGAVWTLYWGTPCTQKQHDFITNSDTFTDFSGVKEHRWIFRQYGTDLKVLSFFDWCNGADPDTIYIDAGSISGTSLSLNINHYCNGNWYCKAQGLGTISNSGKMVTFETLWQFCRADYTPDFNISYYEETQCSATFIIE